MERIDKCKLAIEKGYTYNPETGDVISSKGKIMNKNTNTYIKISLQLDKKSYSLRAHQLAWYITYGEIVDNIDHINGIKDDNRICNLRSVTHQENQWNQTKAKGYSLNRGKWMANIALNNKLIYLGRFDTEDEARVAYLDAKEKYHIIKKV